MCVMCWVDIVGYYIVQWDSYLNSSSVAGISPEDGDGRCVKHVSLSVGNAYYSQEARKLKRVHARRTSSSYFQASDSLYSASVNLKMRESHRGPTESAAEMKDLIYLPVSHNSLSILPYALRS
ncbi:hypothetical protein KQX54_020917 [Cotesia glomerata]|uniref:Uncharacterized protein n=1 Tax=Cotesia glomerata TaxID=32391 RepID=A0AAV7I2W1_COTGL|nr:hypothetical protein KQX54_020917 [Cotesia glomerata]